MAGKTGTAQVFSVGQNERYVESQVAERLRDHSWFIAFAPAEAPRIAVAVLVENGGFGASAAAPIARKIMDAYLLPRMQRTAPGVAPPAAEPPAQGALPHRHEHDEGRGTQATAQATRGAVPPA
jgi:penicillin-binding protein 2